MNFGGSKVQLDMEIDYTQVIRICMRYTLAAAMKLHFELDQGWHYTVLGPSNDTNRLANYLQVSEEELERILTICGLATRSRNKYGTSYLMLVRKMGRSLTAYSWEQFMVEHKMQSHYFDRMKVGGVDDAPVDWIRLGTVGSNENLRTQFKQDYRKGRRATVRFQKSMLHFRRSFSNMIELHQQSGATTTTENNRKPDSATTSSQDEVAATSDLLKEARYKKGGGLQAATQSYIKRSW